MIHSPTVSRRRPQATFKRTPLSVRIVAAVRGALSILAEAFAILGNAAGFLVFLLLITGGTLWFVAWMIEQLRGTLI